MFSHFILHYKKKFILLFLPRSVHSENLRPIQQPARDSLTSFPSLASVATSLPITLRTVTRHSFLPSSKIFLMPWAVSFRFYSRGRLMSDLSLSEGSRSSTTSEAISRSLYSCLLTMGASSMSPAWEVHSLTLQVRGSLVDLR